MGRCARLNVLWLINSRSCSCSCCCCCCSFCFCCYRQRKVTIRWRGWWRWGGHFMWVVIPSFPCHCCCCCPTRTSGELSKWQAWRPLCLLSFLYTYMYVYSFLYIYIYIEINPEHILYFDCPLSSCRRLVARLISKHFPFIILLCFYTRYLQIKLGGMLCSLQCVCDSQKEATLTL